MHKPLQENMPYHATACDFSSVIRASTAALRWFEGRTTMGDRLFMNEMSWTTYQKRIEGARNGTRPCQACRSIHSRSPGRGVLRCGQWHAVVENA
jgi:hypothetical protein